MRKLLEHPHRIVRTEHGNRAREPDTLGPRRNRRERNRRRGNQKVGPMMLADGEHVKPELVGQDGFLEQVSHSLLGAHASSARDLRAQCEHPER